MTTDELLDLKDEIDQAKETLAELNGQKKALMTQLKDTWKCSTVAQAQKKLEELKEELNKLNVEINKRLKEIGEKYPL